MGRTSSTTEKPIFRDNTPDETCKTVFGDSGICKAASTCAFRDSEDHALSDCSIPSHICCKQLTSHPPSILTRFAGLADDKTFDKPEAISVEKIEETLQSIKFGFAEVSN